MDARGKLPPITRLNNLIGKLSYMQEIMTDMLIAEGHASTPQHYDAILVKLISNLHLALAGWHEEEAAASETPDELVNYHERIAEILREEAHRLSQDETP